MPAFALEKIRKLWMRVPFRHMLLAILILWVVGWKQPYPFTRFPMYSNFGEKAEVMFVADQENKPMALVPVFHTLSSAVKKRYYTELKKLIKGARDSSKATNEERTAAAKIILAGLMADVEPSKIPKDAKVFRLRCRTFQLTKGKLTEAPEVTLAEVEVKR